MALFDRAGVAAAGCVCETAGFGRGADGAVCAADDFAAGPDGVCAAPSERPSTSVVSTPMETSLIFQNQYTALSGETPSFHCTLSSRLVNKCQRGLMLWNEVRKWSE